MAFAIFFSLTIILAVSFAVSDKNLHPFEISFMWMIIIVVHHNFITITATNLKLFGFSDVPANYWTFVCIRVFTIPLLIIFYFDRMVVRRPYQKWAWLPLGVLLLTGLEYMGERLDLYTYTRWKYWWSIIEWVGLFLLIHFPWLWYRKLLAKEVT